ncbi:hypothetical protein ACFXD5_06710 [Streptomyces sp. NPDC059385]|uniref:hypothetical protein n=1 Tax=Streptomyces sp. NPDC059385 TaxID=3346817 RepID=UPI0036CD5FD9
MTHTPINPTAIIPPNQPPIPPAPPTVPPAGWPPPTPTPGPIEVHVTLHPEPVPPEPSLWARLAEWLRRFGRPWQAAAALTAAVLPIPGTGYSAATTWAYTVELGRDLGPWQPYALGLLPLVAVLTRILRHGGTVRRLFLLVVTTAGGWAAVDPFDVVTILTGVTG